MKKKKETRNKVATIRWTQKEWQLIVQNAKRCGMRPSTYIRLTVCGYQPRMALNEEEKILAQGVIEGLQVVQPFTNAIRGATQNMTPEQRNQYILSLPNIRIWYKVIQNFITYIKKTINNIKNNYDSEVQIY